MCWLHHWHSASSAFPYPPKPLEDLLVAGKIDALLTPHTLDELKPKEQRKLRPLIANPQQAEEEYLALTGFYPITTWW